MKYLVTMQATEGFATLPLETVIQQVEGRVFPSFEILNKLEAEGKISGGVCVGERRIAFIAKAANNTEVDKLIQSLPLWGMTTTQVTALNGFGERHTATKDMIGKMRGTAG